MKRTWILLFLTILTRICCFSENISQQISQDSIVYVTAQEIKYANLIFIEHQRLTTDNILLEKQIDYYKSINNNLVKVDSLRVQQLNDLDTSYLTHIQMLNNEIKKKDKSLKGWKIGGITISAGLFLFLLLK